MMCGQGRGGNIKIEYYSVIKKNKNVSFSVTEMDLEGVMLGEISQTETDKYYTISLLIES